MLAELTKLVVKVGNQSDIMFNSKSSRAYRAITIKELQSIVQSQKNLHIVVIENIKQSEYDSIKSFIYTFKSADPRNKVFFYVKDNDDFTCGIADELAYDIYLSLKDLHKAIGNNFSVNIGTDLSTKTTLADEYSASSGIDFDNTFDSSFGETLDAINKTQSSILDQEVVYELPNIENKDDLGILDESIIEDDNVKIIETEENNNETDENTSKGENDESLDRAIIQINALKVEKTDIMGQLETALGRIRHLTELVEAIEDEKNSYKNIMESIHKSDIILEDPIGLAEYEDLVKELDTLKSEYSALREQVSNEKIGSEELAKANKNINNLMLELEELRVKLAIAEENAKGLAEADEDIERLTSESHSLQARIASDDGRIQAESLGRLKVTKLVTKAIREVNIVSENLAVKVSEVYAISEKLTELEAKKDEYEQIIKILNIEIGELKLRCVEADTLIEAAKSGSGDELNKLNIQKIELQGKLDLIASQLAAKEYQYNTLVQAYGVDENSADTIIENNKTLEGVNRSLREQVVMIKNEYEQAKRDRIFAMQSAKALDEANKQLKTTLNVVTSGMSAGGIGMRVPPCNYTGKGMIIPVFGCGSFGITTTAMSIALKLAVDAKVLFIDFDMVMPKADGWFKVNPLVRNIPDYDATDTKSTGLGLFVDRQVHFFLSYVASIINKLPIPTKNGSVDYISGFYCRPDTIKLISADYTSFFNYCGNNYTYIVVDFGRLGSSQLNDIIIKMVSDIAYRNVVVTTNDKFEIRNFSMKLEESNIDKNSIAWLVNMCENTSMEAATKKYISPAEHSMMPFNSNLYGKKIDFTKDKFTRDKLELLMNAIFRK